MRDLLEQFKDQKCRQHKEKIQEWCLKCQKGVCNGCLEQHQSHSYQKNNTISKNQNRKLTFKSFILIYLQKLNQQRDKLIQKINSSFDNYISQIEEEESYIKQHYILKNKLYHSQSLAHTRIQFKQFATNYTNIPQDCVQKKTKIENLIIYNSMIEEVIDNTLSNSILYSNNLSIHQTPAQDDLKYFHWFEWNKKQICLYDLITYQCVIIELDMPFNVPSFSRSIIVPHLQQIFLVGGEEPEYHPRKEIFMFDLKEWNKNKENDFKLIKYAQMPEKKFDCTLSYLDGWIYIISGKGRSGEVVGSCHRYDPKKKKFENLAEVRYARYAASAVASGKQKRIYLFGGRLYSNRIANEIEVLEIEENRWDTIELSLQSQILYQPVEVCGAIQIRDDQILIFGGSDENIQDVKVSLIFDCEKYELIRKQELPYAQVFIQMPYLFGNDVYALGNEYYMKKRNLHKYNITSNKWTTIF